MDSWAKEMGITVLALSLCGCASTGAYFKDRGRDALDMVTLGFEGIGVGAFVQAGPFMNGLGAVGAYGCGVGLRGGVLGGYRGGEAQAGLFGFKGYYPAYTHTDAPRDKDFQAVQLLSFLFDMEDGKGNVGPHVYGNVEVAAVFGFGPRAGVNVLEILDFVLGWARLDFMKDDFYACQLRRWQRAREEEKEAERAAAQFNSRRPSPPPPTSGSPAGLP